MRPTRGRAAWNTDDDWEGGQGLPNCQRGLQAKPAARSNPVVRNKQVVRILPDEHLQPHNRTRPGRGAFSFSGLARGGL